MTLKRLTNLLSICVPPPQVLSEEVFDMVVIDEAAQALEASCWIPLLKGPRLVLAGDHKQLAPTIKSVKAERMGLGLTLFDRLMKRLGESHSRMLNVQYRMHHVICDWASQAMYNGALVAAESVAQRLVSGLPYVSGAADMTDCPMLLLDTAGCGMEEQEHEDEAGDKGGKKKEEEDEGRKKGKKKGGAGGLLKRSSSNKGEGLVVQAHVRALLEAGLKQEDIAVITPYNGQVRSRSLVMTIRPITVLLFPASVHCVNEHSFFDLCADLLLHCSPLRWSCCAGCCCPTSQAWRSGPWTGFRAGSGRWWCCPWCAAMPRRRWGSWPMTGG